MKQADFPPGWDEERVHRVLAHYENQSEEEAVAEDEAASQDARAFCGTGPQAGEDVLESPPPAPQSRDVHASPPGSSNPSL